MSAYNRVGPEAPDPPPQEFSYAEVCRNELDHGSSLRGASPALLEQDWAGRSKLQRVRITEQAIRGEPKPAPGGVGTGKKKSGGATLCAELWGLSVSEASTLATAVLGKRRARVITRKCNRYARLFNLAYVIVAFLSTFLQCYLFATKEMPQLEFRGRGMDAISSLLIIIKMGLALWVFFLRASRPLMVKVLKTFQLWYIFIQAFFLAISLYLLIYVRAAATDATLAAKLAGLGKKYAGPSLLANSSGDFFTSAASYSGIGPAGAFASTANSTTNATDLGEAFIVDFFADVMLPNSTHVVGGSFVLILSMFQWFEMVLCDAMLPPNQGPLVLSIIFTGLANLFVLFFSVSRSGPYKFLDFTLKFTIPGLLTDKSLLNWLV
jgi:hypothetical protein